MKIHSVSTWDKKKPLCGIDADKGKEKTKFKLSNYRIIVTCKICIKYLREEK